MELRVVRRLGFGRESSRSLSFEEDSDSGHVLLLDCTLSLVAVDLTFVQFNLRLKFCLYTTVHLLLEKCRISVKSSLSTQSVCNTMSPTVGVQSPKFSNPGVGDGVPQN